MLCYDVYLPVLFVLLMQDAVCLQFSVADLI